MKQSWIYVLIIISLFASVLKLFEISVNAQDFKLLSKNKNNIIVTLKNEADIEKSKEAISNIPQVKIIGIKYRDKEWSKKVNKYDLPNMENPFKNEFVIKANKNADISEIYNKIKTMSFVEKIEYYSNKLSLIDKYQTQYFTIIKRNNILLNFENNKALNNDRKELQKLYKEVEKQISNKEYLAEYKRIEAKYSNCEETTTVGMNEFAEKNNKEVDDFLNTVYKKIQSKIPAEDFENLVLSEQKWLKEVDAYKQVYDSMGFGTIGTVVYYGYQTDMKSFRTLLLMLYL